MNKYLPIGSVIVLKEGEKRLMIFNHEQIDKIYHLGLQDEEQYEFNKRIQLLKIK